MKTKTIIFYNGNKTMQVTFMKKHWWSKWKIIEMGGNEGTPISVFDKNTKIVTQIN